MFPVCVVTLPPTFRRFSSVAKFGTNYFLLKIKILAKRKRELTTKFAIARNGCYQQALYSLKHVLFFSFCLFCFNFRLFQFGNCLIAFSSCLFYFRRSLVAFGRRLFYCGRCLVDFCRSLIYFCRSFVYFCRSLFYFGDFLNFILEMALYCTESDSSIENR